MRPYHVLLGLLLATAGLSCKKSIDATTGNDNAADAQRVVPARPGSKVKVANPEYDFGIMEAGQVGRHQFTITSVGDEPLEVKQGKTTCKCTVGGLTAGGRKIGEKESFLLKKGETASIELEWTPKGQGAMFHERATIHTSDPQQPQVDLAIHGQVRDVITLHPQEFWPVGTIDGDKPGEVKGAIGSAILNRFKIKEITCSDKSITANWTPLSKDELKRSQFKSGYKITVTIPPKDSIGRFDEKLTIKTDARNGLTFTSQIAGIRTGPVLIRATPGVVWDEEAMRLSLGRFPATQGKSSALLLYVAGLGDRELKISRVEKDSDILKVALQKMDDPEAAPGKQNAAPAAGRRKFYRLVVSVPPGKEPAVRTGSQAVAVKLHTNHRQMKTMTFSVVFNSF